MEARLRRELMVKKSEARVAASVAAAIAATSATAMAAAPVAPAGAQARSSMADEDDITGEIPLEVMSIIFRFAGLPKEEIVRIF